MKSPDGAVSVERTAKIMGSPLFNCLRVRLAVGELVPKPILPPSIMVKTSVAPSNKFKISPVSFCLMVKAVPAVELAIKLVTPKSLIANLETPSSCTSSKLPLVPA